MTNYSSPVRIAGLGVYLPDQVETAQEIAAQTGIPADVVREKMGLHRKHRAGPAEHVTAMAAKAAQQALADAHVTPGDIDLLIYFGSEYKEFPVWSAAAHVQRLIGAYNAWAYEIYALCGGGIVAFKTARDHLLADPALRRILLVAATREADLVDYTNARSRFLFNIADGAAAAVLERAGGGESPAHDGRDHRVLASALETDGRFSLDVLVPVGGSLLPPASEGAPGVSQAALLSAAGLPSGVRLAHKLDVPDQEGMRARLDPVSFEHFMSVIDRALAASGVPRSEVRFLAATHMKRSIHQKLLDTLNLTWEQTYYLENEGHVQAADQIIGLVEGEKLGRLRPGDVAVLVAAGLGYTWGATVVRW